MASIFILQLIVLLIFNYANGNSIFFLGTNELTDGVHRSTNDITEIQNSGYTLYLDLEDFNLFLNHKFERIFNKFTDNKRLGLDDTRKFVKIFIDIFLSNKHSFNLHRSYTLDNSKIELFKYDINFANTIDDNNYQWKVYTYIWNSEWIRVYPAAIFTVPYKYYLYRKEFNSDTIYEKGVIKIKKIPILFFTNNDLTIFKQRYLNIINSYGCYIEKFKNIIHNRVDNYTKYEYEFIVPIIEKFYKNIKHDFYTLNAITCNNVNSFFKMNLRLKTTFNQMYYLTGNKSGKKDINFDYNHLYELVVNEHLFKNSEVLNFINEYANNVKIVSLRKVFPNFHDINDTHAKSSTNKIYICQDDQEFVEPCKGDIYTLISEVKCDDNKSTHNYMFIGNKTTNPFLKFSDSDAYPVVHALFQLGFLEYIKKHILGKRIDNIVFIENISTSNKGIYKSIHLPYYLIFNVTVRNFNLTITGNNFFTSVNKIYIHKTDIIMCIKGNFLGDNKISDVIFNDKLQKYAVYKSYNLLCFRNAYINECVIKFKHDRPNGHIIVNNNLYSTVYYFYYSFGREITKHEQISIQQYLNVNYCESYVNIDKKSIHKFHKIYRSDDNNNKIMLLICFKNLKNSNKESISRYFVFASEYTLKNTYNNFVINENLVAQNCKPFPFDNNCVYSKYINVFLNSVLRFPKEIQNTLTKLHTMKLFYPGSITNVEREREIYNRDKYDFCIKNYKINCEFEYLENVEYMFCPSFVNDTIIAYGNSITDIYYPAKLNFINCLKFILQYKCDNLDYYYNFISLCHRRYQFDINDIDLEQNHIIYKRNTEDIYSNIDELIFEIPYTGVFIKKYILNYNVCDKTNCESLLYKESLKSYAGRFYPEYISIESLIRLPNFNIEIHNCNIENGCCALLDKCVSYILKIQDKYYYPL